MGKPEVAISKIVFIDLYVNQKKSGLEIARFFGIGRTTVSRYIERYGLEPRNIKEVRKNKFWNGGEVQKKAARDFTRKRMLKNNPNWKGSFLESIGMNQAQYVAIHRWIAQELGAPSTCEHCGKGNLFGHHIVWANKSGQYLWDVKDWLRLCGKCHKKHDANLIYG